MNSATKLAPFALLVSSSAFSCGQSDNVVGTHSSANGGRGSLETGGTGNGVKTVTGSGGQTTNTVTSSGGTSGGAGSPAKPGTGAAGFSAHGGNGGGPSRGSGGIGSDFGGSSSFPRGSTGPSGGSGSALPSPGAAGGLSLTPINGWVDGQSNAVGIQGQFFAAADSTSMIGLKSDFSGSRACLNGTAAKVDMASTPCATLMFTPPAMDCYEQFWGAEVGLNLNQATMNGTPVTFNASALQGFSFEISGDVVPGPAGLRFQVEGPDGKFCNYSAVKIKVGVNTVLFSDLATNCWTSGPDTAERAKSALISIEWMIVTNASSVVPFDLCVSNVRAVLK